MTKHEVKYALWLADEETVMDKECGYERYIDDECGVEAYETGPIVLSELGYDGTLYGYAEMPEAIIVRPLVKKDMELVEAFDELSGNNVASMVDCDEYAWGLFKENELIAYCTLGGADDPEMGFDEYPEWTDDSMLLSDVFVKQEHRGKGYALKLVNEVLLLSNAEKGTVYLTLLDDRLTYFYEKLDFCLIEDGVMVRNSGKACCSNMRGLQTVE